MISAIDNPKRPARNSYADGGIIAAGCGQVEESKRKRTRTF